MQHTDATIRLRESAVRACVRAGGSRSAAASLLARLHELGAAEEELAGHAAALADAQTRLAGLAAAAKEHAQCAYPLTHPCCMHDPSCRLPFPRRD